MGIGDYIRHIRRAHGLSQETFAASLNREQSDISRIETGRVEPDRRLLLDIASQYDDLVVLAFIYGEPSASLTRQLMLRESQLR